MHEKVFKMFTGLWNIYDQQLVLRRQNTHIISKTINPGLQDLPQINVKVLKKYEAKSLDHETKIRLTYDHYEITYSVGQNHESKFNANLWISVWSSFTEKSLDHK